MFGLLVAIIYLSFVSLGLPDSLLGSAWPVMSGQFGVPDGFASIVSVIIGLGTVFSSLMSDRLTKRFGAGLVTAVSTAMTAAALFLFSISTRFWMLAIFAIPYGLGAGGVDAALNNYVALHFKSRHMSWLHCMWGVGASVSPFIMSYALSGGTGWNQGYFIVAIIQIVLSVCIFISLPLWKKFESSVYKTPSGEVCDEKQEKGKALPLKEVFKIRGAATCFLCFFCYCALVACRNFDVLRPAECRLCRLYRLGHSRPALFSDGGDEGLPARGAVRLSCKQAVKEGKHL